MPWRSELSSSIAAEQTASTDALDCGRPGEQRQQQQPPTVTVEAVNEHVPTDITQRVDDLQQRVDDVVGIMFHNVKLVLERDAKITSLEVQAENLQIQALEFRRLGKRLLVRHYVRKYRYQIVIILVILLILTILAITAALLYLLSTMHI